MVRGKYLRASNSWVVKELRKLKKPKQALEEYCLWRLCCLGHVEVAMECSHTLSKCIYV
ncbi:hypothetical protein CIPAW_11G125400 [Carya illinoinensis]|uniref:Uncharacterized protein n=1 Tax=Carya illinoinensis TaxID=32201 RepID=A0A8T1NYM2_CARIL|nr:hypothetical protein CIPAW_11G125400 [Carya illinoinensis]